MTDKYILTTIQVNKVDKITKKALKSKKFEFTVFKDKECTKKFTSVSANTEDGTATFNLRYGEWYIKETKAPVGYLLSNEVKHIKINKLGVFVNDKKIEAENSIHSFIYYNSPLQDDVVHTGDNTDKNTFIYVGLFVSSICLAILSFKKRKTSNCK